MNEPKIRLKGFSGEWKTSKYDEVFSLIGDTGHNVQKTEYCERGSYPIVDQSKELIVGYTDIVQPIDGTNGLIIFGDHTREIKYIDFPFCTGADGTRILKSEETFDALFMYYVCHSLNIPNTGYNRHFKYIKEAIYKTPETKDEQTAIASYFQHLDSLIQSTTKKIESLKQVKAASLQSMFPQEGETTPRVRFKGFVDDWKKVEFGKLLNYEQPTPYLVSCADYESNGIPVLTAGKTFVLGYTSETNGIYTKLPVIIFDDFTTDVKFVTFPFKAKSSAMKMLTSSRKDIDIRFVYESLNNLHFRVENHQRHWLSIFSKLEILVPTFEEQIVIADYFANLDSQITLQTQRLEKLKQIKSACLDNMFV